jgi:hypothetical protein
MAASAVAGTNEKTEARPVVKRSRGSRRFFISRKDEKALSFISQISQIYFCLTGLLGSQISRISQIFSVCNWIVNLCDLSKAKRLKKTQCAACIPERNFAHPPRPLRLNPNNAAGR